MSDLGMFKSGDEVTKVLQMQIACYTVLLEREQKITCFVKLVETLRFGSLFTYIFTHIDSIRLRLGFMQTSALSVFCFVCLFRFWDFFVCLIDWLIGWLVGFL